jgi:hypothetical protein
MLTWALIFAVIALVAGVFGFGGVASAAAGGFLAYGLPLDEERPQPGVGCGRFWVRSPRGGVGLGGALERRINRFGARKVPARRRIGGG